MLNRIFMFICINISKHTAPAGNAVLLELDHSADNAFSYRSFMDSLTSWEQSALFVYFDEIATFSTQGSLLRIFFCSVPALYDFAHSTPTPFRA